ncbi:MAG: aldehyde dehydrogenase family protein, partial [Mycolicibacterium sp.]|nr:aldehyde dehydrogenase family protein [Mycolicibacterium sp.]
VDAARAAAPGWARTAPVARAAAVAAAAKAVSAVAEELAHLNERETGKPHDDALGGVEAGVGTLVQYSELGPLHGGRVLQGQWAATDLMVPQ